MNLLSSLLAMIEAFLPLLSGGTATTIASIITVLEQWLPLIVNGISAAYTPVMNIIAALRNHGAVTPDQITQLNALNATLDAAWQAATAGLDPDAA